MRTLLLLLFAGLSAISFAQEKNNVDRIKVTIESYKYATNGVFLYFFSFIVFRSER